MKVKLNEIELIFLGSFAGMIGTTAGIHINIRYTKTCLDYYSCTNTYLFIGIMLILMFILYLALKRKLIKG